MIKIAQGVCDCLTECHLMGVCVSVCSYASHKISFYKDFVKGKRCKTGISSLVLMRCAFGWKFKAQSGRTLVGS